MFTLEGKPAGTCIRRAPGRAADEFRGRPDSLQGPEGARRGGDALQGWAWWSLGHGESV